MLSNKQLHTYFFFDLCTVRLFGANVILIENVYLGQE